MFKTKYITLLITLLTLLGILETTSGCKKCYTCYRFVGSFILTNGTDTTGWVGYNGGISQVGLYTSQGYRIIDTVELGWYVDNPPSSNSLGKVCGKSNLQGIEMAGDSCVFADNEL